MSFCYLQMEMSEFSPWPARPRSNVYTRDYLVMTHYGILTSITCCSMPLTLTLTFALLLPKSNQFIHESEWTFVWPLKKTCSGLQCHIHDKGEAIIIYLITFFDFLKKKILFNWIVIYFILVFVCAPMWEERCGKGICWNIIIILLLWRKIFKVFRDTGIKAHYRRVAPTNTIRCCRLLCCSNYFCCLCKTYLN